MLSQRTVGRLQRLLEMMFTRQGCGPGVALPIREFSRRLYEADVPRNLLEHLGDRYGWNPEAFVPALHEGWPVAFVRRNDGYGDPVPVDEEKAKGDSYLLVGAAIALQRYEELARDEVGRVYAAFHQDAVDDFEGSLLTDGFEYHDGQIIDADGQAVTPEYVALRNPEGVVNDAPRRQVPAVATANAAEPIADKPVLDTKTRSWSLEAKLAMWALVVAVVAVMATLATPELRRLVGLDKRATPAITAPQQGASSPEANKPRKSTTLPVKSESPTKR